MTPIEVWGLWFDPVPSRPGRFRQCDSEAEALREETKHRAVGFSCRAVCLIENPWLLYNTKMEIDGKTAEIALRVRPTLYGALREQRDALRSALADLHEACQEDYFVDGSKIAAAGKVLESIKP